MINNHGGKIELLSKLFPDINWKVHAKSTSTSKIHLVMFKVVAQFFPEAEVT